jgi:ORF6N domain
MRTVSRKNRSPMKSIPPDPLCGRIFTFRGQRVILDADLARLCGTTTKRFNEAFKRNTARFPKDFAFQLTAEEFDNVRSQFETAYVEAPDK